MKKAYLVIAVTSALVAMPVFAQNDQTIMFEIGVGFGAGAGGKTNGNDNARWCKNRNTGRMVFGAIRYSYNDVEVHVARWFHDEKAPNCDLDSWAVGLGYVLDTQDPGKAGTNDIYASWTPGVAYTWGKNKNFTGQVSDGTNWRETGHWQTFNRFAIGDGGNDGAVEIAAHRYGTWNPNAGEYFATIGGQFRSLDNGTGAGGNATNEPITPPGSDGTTITIVNTQPASPVPEGTVIPVVPETPPIQTGPAESVPTVF